MKIIDPSFEILSEIDREKILRHLTVCGKTCYQSEIVDDAENGEFIMSLIRKGHESVLEHAGVTIRFICDRGVSHELVRHRIASFSQESTRYCNYSKDRFGNDVTFIRPVTFDPASSEYLEWKSAMLMAESHYFSLMARSASAQIARGVLPNSVKTDVVMTMNFRELRHFFKVRALGVTGKPHPQMLQLSVPLLSEMKRLIPELFFDLEV